MMKLYFAAYSSSIQSMDSLVKESTGWINIPFLEGEWITNGAWATLKLNVFLEKCSKSNAFETPAQHKYQGFEPFGCCKICQDFPKHPLSSLASTLQISKGAIAKIERFFPHHGALVIQKVGRRDELAMILSSNSCGVILENHSNPHKTFKKVMKHSTTRKNWTSALFHS